ncbi:GPALPP motifs-containing protein 1 [Diachasmimorpha longicaudata]|uniref:GPALPP motifs-containing protein 1 n=1 Tax=Diachasmimorpha longicaudata TaxID=58733 RepID=UPI0030B90531
MTTMDSDSESQDSDDGRRFRFEATRKDSTAPLHTYRRDTSSHTNASRHCRTRSRDRTRHPRGEYRDSPASTIERTTDRSHYDEPRSSKERKTASTDSGRKRESGSKNRDIKKSHKTSRDTERRNSSCRDDRVLKHRDDKRKHSRDRNRETKSSGKLRKYSRDRDQLRRREKSGESKKSSYEKIVSLDKEKTNNFGDKLSEDKPDSQDCKDLNLSDFDIVSDTEGNSDNSTSTAIESGNGEIERRNCKGPVNDKVKLRSDDKSSGSYLSNPDDFSDFLLASTSAKTITADDSDIQNSKHDETGFANSNGKKEPQTTANKYEDIDEEMYGPALPPTIEGNSGTKLRIIGPTLPDYLTNTSTHHVPDEEDKTFGPALPENLGKFEGSSGRSDRSAGEARLAEGDDEDGSIGPLPADHPTLQYDFVQKQLEYRAQLIKRELAEIGDADDRKREEWMTELPRVQGVNGGLTARKFRMRAGPDLSDQSVWTDTPADRAKKRKEYAMGKSAEQNGEPKKNLPDEKESKKRKGKSLLEMHQKKLHAKKNKQKKEDKKSGKLPERRPFDRDVDLQVNRFDKARQKSILIKAAALDDRFSSGKI